VTVAKLAKATMVDSSISPSVCPILAFYVW
jgi:hypothetical protein